MRYGGFLFWGPIAGMGHSKKVCAAMETRGRIPAVQLIVALFVE